MKMFWLPERNLESKEIESYVRQKLISGRTKNHRKVKIKRQIKVLKI